MCTKPERFTVEETGERRKEKRGSCGQLKTIIFSSKCTKCIRIIFFIQIVELSAMILLVGLLSAVFGLEFKDQTMDKPNLARFMLPPDKDYMDWWKLTPENYNERVLESVDAWIVAIHPKNQQPEVWRKMAPRYRGQIFFGKLQDDVINEDMKKRYKYDGRPIVS